MPSKKPALVELDPKALTIHPLNVRRDLGDLRALTRSVKESGVLVPLLVVPHDGGHLVIAGHRRQAAAVAAERPSVWCIVRHDLEGDVEQITGMVIENIHRKPLTAGEEAAAYEQLALLGLSDSAIARHTGMTRQHVSKGRKVAASDVAVAVADRYDLTLDQALVLAEFADDREAVKALTVAARTDPGRFPHIASRLRQDRNEEQAHAEAVAALTASGVTVLDGRPGGDATSLRELTDSDDGTPITTDDHAACPGHAAYVPRHRPDAPEHFCLDPDAHGHRSRYASSGRSQPTPMNDEQKAERREVIENNKAWRAAEPVRREFIRSLLTRKTPPKGALRFVTEQIIRRPERVGDGTDVLLAELLGVEHAIGRDSVGATHLVGVTDQRLPLALLARVAADIEQRTGVHSWRNPSTEVARWFTFLAEAGYTLADVEQIVTAAAAREVTAA
jgi:ParB family transcriptional regulator, chromosome partitioning protein